MTWRDGGARVVSDIFVTIARCRVPDYPAPRGELFLRRDSTQAALSRLSCPGEENIKLVPAAYSRCSRCYARQSLLHAFFLTTLIHSDLEDRTHVCFVSKRAETSDARYRLNPSRKRSIISCTHNMYVYIYVSCIIIITLSSKIWIPRREIYAAPVN